MAGVKGRSGGARVGAGRKRAVAPAAGPLPAVVAEGTDPEVYLGRVMCGLEPAIRLRIEAAKVLCMMKRARMACGGKKAEQTQAAKTASKGRFAPSSPPKMQ
jgi:phage terminase small subunit